MQILGMDAMLFAVVVAGAIAGLFFLLGFHNISDDKVGIQIKKIFGKKMAQGQIIARNGEVGIQANTLMPGFVWRNPVTWKIIKVPIVSISPTEIGLVESVDGEPIPKGRLLGDEVQCNQFQDAKLFLESKGKKGPQVGMLVPGQYRVNTMAFKITRTQATRIQEENIGIVVANDGTPLPSGYIVAPKPREHPDVKFHKYFQDGQAFLDADGYRGPQLDTLQPGNYYINTLLFRVDQEPIAEVPPGYVAVLRSNVGIELEKKEGTPIPTVGAVGPVGKGAPEKQQVGISQPVHEESESLLILDKNMRGIWKEPVAPGRYNLNTLAFDAYLVPTSAVTIDWASGFEQRAQHDLPEAIKKGEIRTSSQAYDESRAGEKATEFFKFSQLRVTSMDGFQLDVDVRMIIRVRPQNAAFIIARFGSVKNLIEQIVHPLIDSSFRNKAGEEKAINFILSRTELQRSALEKAQKEFEQYHVEAQNLLIAYIKVDQALLDTQTKREIALQQQAQYDQEAKAQEKRIEVQSKQANADKQPEVVAAALSIEIERSKAEALRRQAEGIRDSTKTKAEGDAFQAREVGCAIADAYSAQADAVGREATALIKIIDEVGAKNIRITPDVLVSGGGAEGGLFNAWLANMINEQRRAVKEEKSRKD